MNLTVYLIPNISNSGWGKLSAVHKIITTAYNSNNFRQPITVSAVDCYVINNHSFQSFLKGFLYIY